MQNSHKEGIREEEKEVGDNLENSYLDGLIKGLVASSVELELPSMTKIQLRTTTILCHQPSGPYKLKHHQIERDNNKISSYVENKYGTLHEINNF